MPGIFNLDHAGNLDLRRLEAWECPIAGRRTVNTPIMSILCNAMQFKVQRRMPDPGGVRFRRVNPSTRPAANRGAATLWFGQNPSPFWGRGLRGLSFSAWRHPSPRG